MNTEFALHLIHQIEWVFTLTVHLVDEHHHWGLAHTANLHQTAGLGLHTLRRVNHDHHRIYGGQSAEGVFCKVLVTRGIKDIDMVVIVVKSHHGCGHGDSTLFLDLHPVGGGCFANLIGFNGTCHVDSTSVEQKFFGQCGLTCIWVRDNRKRTTT